jgi:hypothetical protein
MRRLRMNEFAAKWSQIFEVGHAAGRFRVFPDHLLNFFLGISSEGKREVIVEIMSDSTNRPSLPSFQNIGLSISEINGGYQIGITLNEEDLSQSFSVMCFDLAQRSIRGNTVASAVQIFLTALNHWADLFKKRRTNGLSPSEVIGLLGELLVIEKLITDGSIDIEFTIQGWRGPDGDARDIGFNGSRIEIKTQRSTKPISLKISSLDQLDDNGDSVYIVLNRISPSQHGCSLNEIVIRLHEHLQPYNSAHSEFERKLELALFDSEADYANNSYGLDESFVYIVNKTFPRLTMNNVPKGITAVNYVINGASIDGHKVSWRDLFGAINVGP